MVIAMSCYNRNSLKYLSLLLLVSFLSVYAQGYNHIASDSADNYIIFGDGSVTANSGFNAWQISGSGGVFTGPAHNSALNSNTKSFGFWSSSGYQNAKISFNTLRENERIVFQMSYDAISTGSRGFDIMNGSSPLFTFRIISTGYQYSTNSGVTWIPFGSTASKPVLTFTLVKGAGSSCSISISTTAGTGLENTVFPNLGATINAVNFFVGDTGGGSANDFFVNKIYKDLIEYTSTRDGNWSDPSTWIGGVPGVNSQIVINHNVIVDNVASSNHGKITINAGKNLIFGTGAQISIDGNWANNGTLDMTAGGTVSFGGASTLTISGTNPFNNVNLSCGVNFGSSSTVNGTLSIRSGGFVSTNAPAYGTNSTLEYNSVTGYGVSLEWQSSNEPKNITLTYSSINLPNSTRTVPGNLIIGSGSTMNLNGTSGADLNVKGDFTNNGNFNSNGRLVTFNGTSTQTIGGSATTTSFNFLIFANDASLSSDISASNTFVINSGKTLTANARAITLSSGVNFSNLGTFTAGTGKVVFLGSSTIFGTNTFYNVDISGGVDFGAATINNKLTVFSGGSAKGTISYGTNATLEYNGRTGHTASNEWPASNPPKNVILTSNSSVTAPSGTRTLDGNLTINGGSTFTLSGTSGSDFELKGDLVNAGTLSPNGRLFTFLGTSQQTISGGGTTSFTYLKISNDVSLNATSISVGISLTIDASKTLTCNSNNITIAGGGSFTNNGFFSAGTGKVIFSGSGSIAGTLTFNNVDISGAVNFQSASTVNGVLQILPNGAVSNNAPIYGENSTLKYATGVEYNRFTEWLSTDGGRGLPFNVVLSNNTTLNLARIDAPTQARSINGSLTIEAGSALYLRTEKVGDTYSPMTGSLTINGNIVNSGTLALSTAVGGDLIVKGNFTNNGTFTHNGRLVTFNGSSPQSISGSSTTPFGYVVFDNDISLSSGTSAANSFVISAGKTLSANAQTITLGSSVNFSNSGNFSAGTGKVVFQGTSTISGTNSFYNVEINGAVNFGTSTINNILTFKSGASVADNVTYHATNSTLDYNGLTVSAGNEFPATNGPANITLTGNSSVTFGVARTVPGKVTVTNGSSLIVTGALVFNNFELSGTVNFGTTSTLNGTMTFKTGGSVLGTPSYGSSSTLEYSGITSYTTGSEWPLTNGPKNLSLVSNASVAVGADRTISGNLSIQSGSTLRVSGDRKITLSGTGASITQNGNIDANPSFGNTLNFDITGTYSLTGTGNFDVYNLNVKNGALLSLNDKSMRTGQNGTITIESGGTLSTGSGIIGGYGGTSNFTLASGATLEIGSPGGIASLGNTGNIQTTNRSYDAGANYIYNGSSSQTTGSGLPESLSGNVTVSNIAGVFLSKSYSTSGNFTVSGNLNCGNFTVSGTGTFTLSSDGTLKSGSADGVNGSILTSNKSLSTGAIYEFNGSVPQVTGTDLPETVSKLIVNNSNGLTLSKSTEVTSELGLVSGKLTLDSYSLTLGAASNLFGTPSSNAMVVATGTGKLRKMYSSNGSFTFPVGDANKYTPATVDFKGGTLDGTTYAEVNLTASAHPKRNTDSQNYLKRYWTISSNVVSPSAQITLKYDDTDIEGLEDNFVVGRWTGTAWSNPAFDGRDIENNTITATTIGFSDFTGGDAGALPVELISFNVAIRNGLVDLKWETATEVNNHGFEIERMSATSSWNKIGFVEGHGSSNSPKYYSFSDKPVGSGKFSYRLKQIDNDGHFEYSPVVEVMVDNLPDGYVLEQNYPNPFNPETSIRFALKEDTKALLKIFNAMGEEVITLFDGIAEAGRYYDLRFDGTNLSSGFYIYKLVAGEHVSVKKMVLMK